MTSLVDKDRRTLVTEWPDLFAMSLLSKSSYFGFLWPSFYLKLLSNPKDILYLYGGVQSKFDKFNITTEDHEWSINGEPTTPEEVEKFKEKMRKMFM